MDKLSPIKILTAVSFLCIIVVSEKLAIPMVLILLLGLVSISTGNPNDFIISCLGLFSVGFLLFSSFVDKKKLNFVLSILSILILTMLGLHALRTGSVYFPLYSTVSYIIFFSLIFTLFIGYGAILIRLNK